MRHPTTEEIEISDKLCDEADTLSEEEKEELRKRLKEIDEEECHGFPWIT